MAKVKNLASTTDHKCSTCGSWLRHWENGTGKGPPALCGTSGCSGSPVVGGHVKKVDGTDGARYITPICAKCNARDDEYSVVWDLYPASATTRCKS